jgi:hypothetical protein
MRSLKIKVLVFASEEKHYFSAGGCCLMNKKLKQPC